MVGFLKAAVVNLTSRANSNTAKRATKIKKIAKICQNEVQIKGD